MEVPWQRLSANALRGVIEEFVTREGTDYGASYSLEQKVEHVMGQLRRAEAIIVFDDDTETVNIVHNRRGRRLWDEDDEDDNDDNDDAGPEDNDL
jgi:uncharacterized protein YheU (UPF0270 family)